MDFNITTRDFMYQETQYKRTDFLLDEDLSGIEIEKQYGFTQDGDKV